MKGRAVFDGRCFVLEEVLPGLEFDSSIVICKNDDGKRFACPLQIWEDHAEIDPAVQGGTVTNYSSSDEKVALFRSLFHGREDLFAKRWYNIRSEQSGYSPACGNEWVSGLCNKKAVSCKNCTNKDLLPIGLLIARFCSGSPCESGH